MEYREAFENRGEATIDYIVAPDAIDYRLRMSAYNDHALPPSVGMDLAMGRNSSTSLLVGHLQARDATGAGSFRPRVSYRGQTAADAHAGRGASVQPARSASEFRERRRAGASTR